MIIFRFCLVVFVCFFCLEILESADHRELLYNFEVRTPNHATKPKIELGAKERIEEKLTRGLVAVPGENQVYLSWRLLKSDPGEVAFNLYRSDSETQRTRLNPEPLKTTTDFLDREIESGKIYLYEICSILDKNESQPEASVSVTPGESLPYHRVQLRDRIVPNRVAVGDLDGDGKFDFVVLHPNSGIDPAGQPNRDGLTYKLDAYLNDGTFLWQYDLGPGIEPGIWYSPFIVYDFDGDGKAEIALKIAENFERIKDGPNAGRVFEGPEHLGIIDGMSGKVVARADWPARTPRLGDYNRTNRNQITFAYLDGKTPCIIAIRGTYKAMFADAWEFKDKELRSLWKWDGDEENPVVRSQGAHQTQCADIDGDGQDEVLLGSAVLDDDGTLLWSAGLGHSDSAILSVIDPSRPGMQVLYGNEIAHEKRGVCLVDAKTGRQIWNIDRPTLHVGGAMAADIDPERAGLECFAAEDSKGGSRERYLLDAKGRSFGSGADVPGTRDWVWWDADKLRENIVSRNDTLRIVKYKGATVSEIRGRLVMVADLYGDWREELVTAFPGELRVYSSGIPAIDRRVSLLQDSKYRIDVANRTQGYVQAPTVSFYLGE